MWLFVVVLRFLLPLSSNPQTVLFFWHICVPLLSRLLHFFRLHLCRPLPAHYLLCTLCHFSTLSLISRSSHFQRSVISNMQLMLRFSSCSHFIHWQTHSYFVCCQATLLLLLRGWMVFGKSHLQPHSTTPRRWVTHLKCALWMQHRIGSVLIAMRKNCIFFALLTQTNRTLSHQ